MSLTLPPPQYSITILGTIIRGERARICKTIPKIFVLEIGSMIFYDVWVITCGKYLYFLPHIFERLLVIERDDFCGDYL